MNTHDHPYSGLLSSGGRQYRIIDLQACFGRRLHELPVVLRLLLENVSRNMRGDERVAAIDALFAWRDRCSSMEELAFQPGRVLMHDTTSTPALVDIAAMRDALAEAGTDPRLLSPTLPVEVSVDHSLAVEVYARPDAAARNIGHEVRRNRERYRFLRWAANAVDGVHVNPPGTGIMHTINLEQLATVVTIEHKDGIDWAVPDMMIGTDSHTPMINGIGVLGWGVGGLEAQTVMFGMPVLQRIPDVVGVRLSGALQPGALATDLALLVTQRLREIGISGEFVEFFGPGVSTLSAGERSVVANMAPEYGATTGYFPVDQNTLDYLRQTGRDEHAIRLVHDYMRHTGLWFDPDAQPLYTRVLDINLSEIGMNVSGPRRPQDRMDYRAVPAALAGLDLPVHEASSGMPAFPVALAAITSCTNTSDPGLLMAAGLLARKARERGLSVAPWVKTSLGPGSPAAESYLKRAGLLDDLSAVGFDIVGYGCTTCIGNSGPLPQAVIEQAASASIHPVAVLSGNRNFPGRIHPDLDLGFLMSPPLVIAYALAGDAMIAFEQNSLGTDDQGNEIFLRDIWPTREEIDSALAQGLDKHDFSRDFAKASRNALWEALDAPDTPRFPWDQTSTTLRRPPFASLDQGTQLGSYLAFPLMVLGDDITTDHISPASAIPPDSLVADFLVERGEDRKDLNVFASRRGNWEVMLRGAFHSKTLVNRLCPGAPVAHTLHIPSGIVQPLWEVAQRYREDDQPLVLVAGHRYGTGSSRDWAAKVQRLLGIRAVLALSFERIHRSNLIGMGILPLRLPDDMGPDQLAMAAGDRIEIQAPAHALVPRAQIPIRLHRGNGVVQSFTAMADVQTQLEAELLREGGVIPSILRRTLAQVPSQ
ncbi:aconitate hydratase AcnA [Alcaligenaceae bacterium]|nr:aconitate hydratase AcnA [Alcaligenaceae bacterium]